MNDPPKMGPRRPWTQGARLWALLMCGSLAACGDLRSRTEPEPEPEAEPWSEPEIPPDYGYATTLSRLPVDFVSHLTMSGTGHVTGRVEEGRLVLEGAFQDVESAATEAHLHRARPGLRGPSVAPLAITTAGDGTSGTVTGAVDLTDDLVQALENAELYVQIRSEDNPVGVLRGWLFPVP